MTNRDWCPTIEGSISCASNSSKSNPMGESFQYAEEFKSLELEAVQKELREQ